MNPVINRPCSEETETAIREALSTLHTVIANAVGREAPASNQYDLYSKLACNTLRACDTYRRESALNSLKAAVLVIAKDAVSAKRAERDAFNAELAKIENPAFRAIVAKSMPATDHVVIPLASFASVFPAGTDTAAMRSGLQAIGCKLQGPVDNMGVRLSVV